MTWQIIQTNFSIFQTEEWKSIYCQGKQNKIILLPYKNTDDIVSICLLAKKDYILDQLSPFIPTSIYFKLSEYFPLQSDLAYQLDYKEATKVSKKELSSFNLTQEQVPAALLVKSYNEPYSKKYLDINLHWSEAEFLFIQKEQIPLIMRYIDFMNKQKIDFTIKSTGVKLERKIAYHNQILFSKNILLINELIKEKELAILFSLSVTFSGYDKSEYLNYQHLLLNNKLNDLINAINDIEPAYQRVDFYKPITLTHSAFVVEQNYKTLINELNQIIGFYYNDPEILSTCFEINKLRAQIISQTNNPSFFVEVSLYLNYVNYIYKNYDNYRQSNQATIDFLNHYLQNVYTKYPFFKMLDKSIFETPLV